MSKMMAMLSKMDKKELEAGLAQVSKLLQSKEADKMIEDIKKNNLGK